MVGIIYPEPSLGTDCYSEMEKKPYEPISCTYYDYIEHFAVLKQVVHIRYYGDDGNPKELDTVILDTLNKKEEGEFIILNNLDHPLRMDRIISINEHILADYKSC